MGRFARGLRDDREPEFAPRAEGRKSSGRKERGRDASPSPFTSAGNADRIRVFRYFRLKIKKESCSDKMKKEGVVSEELPMNTEKIVGLRYFD